MSVTVIKAPAGLGKTRAFARRIAESVGGTVEVYVPTHRLAEEWRDLILGINPHKRVVLVRGRDFKDDHGAPPCRKAVRATQLIRSGFSVYNNLCRQSQRKPLPALRCEHYDQCAYIAQFQYADVYIYTHAYLPLERGALERWKPSTVVIDEAFFKNCIRKITVPRALLTHSMLPEAARGMCGDIDRAISSRSRLNRGIWSVEPSEKEYRAALKATKETSVGMSPALSAGEFSEQLKRQVSFAGVHMLLRHVTLGLLARKELQSIDYDPTTGDIVVHHQLPITRFTRRDHTEPAIFILDASASIEIIGQFFASYRIKMEQIDAERNAHVVQCHSTRGSTTSMVPARNRGKKSIASAERRLQEVESFIEILATGSKKVLVVGPSAVVGNPAMKQEPLIRIPGHCASGHFNAIRGIDHWKDFDTVVVIGRNEPPIKAVEDMARALFYHSPGPLLLTGQWEYQVRGYSIEGQQLGVEVAVHPDLRVQAVLEQLREEESVQALDRIRLIHCPERKTVVLLSNIPLDVRVDELRSWDEIVSGGTRLERAWGQSEGVLPLEPTWLAAKYPGLWATAAAAKQDVRVALKKDGFPNIISIRKTILFKFQYKKKSQRRWSDCLSRDQDVGWVAGQLAALIGEVVAVKGAEQGLISPERRPNL